MNYFEFIASTDRIKLEENMKFYNLISKDDDAKNIINRHDGRDELIHHIRSHWTELAEKGIIEAEYYVEGQGSEHSHQETVD